VALDLIHAFLLVALETQLRGRLGEQVGYLGLVGFVAEKALSGHDRTVHPTGGRGVGLMALVAELGHLSDQVDLA
jgi:hypothetical protein